jgi:prepilin-type N-terminal cleavage/methylation domain-containing protein
MKTKAFTLIELLVVVAIIGILAAVGVVAYNGYTASAKKAASNHMHKQIVNFIKLQKQKCDLGDTVKLEEKPEDGGRTTIVDCGQFGNYTGQIITHFKYLDFWNPFEKDDYMPSSSCNWTVHPGCTEITYGAKDSYKIKTCINESGTLTCKEDYISTL